MNNVLDNSSNRCVGIIDSVSPCEIKGFLLDDAPTSVSILEGNISLFPRINSYLMIPNETGWLVGIISWIGYNHNNNMNNEVNLPQGSRMIYISILGHIKKALSGLKFERGTFSLPTVGDSILLPTMEQLKAIVDNKDGATITIGISPLAGNQDIKLSVDNLFGRHLAILGNTGSGKSCTVSGIIRWSIEESFNVKGTSPNARFIILDPNGEYKNAFDGLDIDVNYCSIKSVEQGMEDTKQLRVPAWMWTSQEWSSILQASNKTQKPLLRESLRDLKASNIGKKIVGKKIVNRDTTKIYLYSLKCFLMEAKASMIFLNKSSQFARNIFHRIEDLSYCLNQLSDKENKGDILDLITFIKGILKKHYKSFLDKKTGKTVDYYEAFSLEEIIGSIEKINKLFEKLGNIQESLTCNEDDPIEFELNNLAEYIQILAQDTPVSQYIDFMTIRIKSMLRNSTISSVVGNNPQVTLLDWIKQYISNSNSAKGKITIIDLSLVPIDIVHLIVAVISRLIFESLQRYRKCYGKELPTLLVMDEAHTFIRRYNENSDEFSADKLCTQIFERIAREGRKFGLGLIISSQRPSELSSTVLSQCNSYILHRIVNDKDQEMVKRLVPDNIGNILDELPSLPTRKAIVLGSAVPIPTIVEIKNLTVKQRPKSDNPQFWDVWTGREARDLNWKPITDVWQSRKYINDIYKKQ